MKKTNAEKVDMSNVINKLFEGDCLQYMQEIPDGSIDMILCDLPYGMTQNQWDCYIPLDKSAGGESTLSVNKKSMFPDVLLYEDEAQTKILQGWELKMPDVRITDEALITDATRKANLTIGAPFGRRYMCISGYREDVGRIGQSFA